jgi:hypothetical protein
MSDGSNLKSIHHFNLDGPLVPIFFADRGHILPGGRPPIAIPGFPVKLL